MFAPKQYSRPSIIFFPTLWWPLSYDHIQQLYLTLDLNIHQIPLSRSIIKYSQFALNSQVIVFYQPNFKLSLLCKEGEEGMKRLSDFFLGLSLIVNLLHILKF